MTINMEEPLVVQEVQGSSLWYIHVEVMREDSIWLGTAATCCGTESFPVLRAVRYGPTAKDVLSASVESLSICKMPF